MCRHVLHSPRQRRRCEPRVYTPPAAHPSCEQHSPPPPAARRPTPAALAAVPRSCWVLLTTTGAAWRSASCSHHFKCIGRQAGRQASRHWSCHISAHYCSDQRQSRTTGTTQCTHAAVRAHYCAGVRWQHSRPRWGRRRCMQCSAGGRSPCWRWCGRLCRGRGGRRRVGRAGWAGGRGRRWRRSGEGLYDGVVVAHC